MSFTKLRPILGYGLHSRQILLKKHETYNMFAAFPIGKNNHCRTYKDFGHRNSPPEHPLKKCYLLGFISLVIYQFIDWDQ